VHGAKAWWFGGGGGAVPDWAVASVVEPGLVTVGRVGVVDGVGVVVGAVRACLAGVAVAAGAHGCWLPGVYWRADSAGGQ